MTTTLRCLLVWIIATVSTAVTAWWSLSTVGPTTSFEGLVVAVSGYALAACAAWAWLVCTIVVAQALSARGLPVRRVPGVPGWAARTVLAACGVAALAVVPAHASSYEVPQPPTATLDGLPFPDRAVGPAHAGQARRSTTAPRQTGAPALHHAASESARRTIVVRPGDSLWRIASTQLAPAASDAEIAAATAALHRLNRDAIGPDPDLIQPGLRLHTPRS
jgi:hypothetical protein